MERAILHIDCNKCYASVEGIYHPELRDKPFAAGGNFELRHGIILTKNEIAGYYGIKPARRSTTPTGNALPLRLFIRTITNTSDIPRWYA